MARSLLGRPGEWLPQVSQTCKREEYEERVLPIKIGAPAQEGSWSQARNGTYPFTLPVEYAVQSVQGKATLKDNALAMGEVRVAVPEVPPSLAGRTVEVRLYYVLVDKERVALLLVGDRLF